MIVAAFTKPAQGFLARGIDVYQQVVEPGEFGSGGVHNLNDDCAGVGDGVDLVRRQGPGPPVVAPVAGIATAGERGEHLFAQPLPVEVTVVALHRIQPSTLLRVHRAVEIVSVHDHGATQLDKGRRQG
ncbi:hypothetical protein OG785_03275 [Streptomyces sp. NBC_00006]|uniref:hypothetical protein n=1 Tax=Streptomyces sp. NBC_00006 TaxID=2975619 RepID=UPI00224ED0B3|nr:hypothetical protein [Streptomyces sp. NBC_00006]MCX5529596.1 hypothetical protein [Streptomyces sp. NBC_00006]